LLAAAERGVVVRGCATVVSGGGSGGARLAAAGGAAVPPCQAANLSLNSDALATEAAVTRTESKLGIRV
jgi:hypothetical protein